MKIESGFVTKKVNFPNIEDALLLEDNDYSKQLSHLVDHKKAGNRMPDGFDFEISKRWNPRDFEWTSPVGNLENVKSFLDFRREKWKALL